MRTFSDRFDQLCGGYGDLRRFPCRLQLRRAFVNVRSAFVISRQERRCPVLHPYAGLRFPNGHQPQKAGSRTSAPSQLAHRCSALPAALPPKADMCGATRDVRYVPIADIHSRGTVTRKRRNGKANGRLTALVSLPHRCVCRLDVTSEPLGVKKRITQTVLRQLCFQALQVSGS